MKNELDALTQWIAEQKNCQWAICTFRAEGVISAPKSLSRTLRALQWTVDDARRHWHQKNPLRFVPTMGGEPEHGVTGHLHALLEIPSNATTDALRERLSKMWPYFLKKQHRKDIEASVWIRIYEPGPEAPRYFARFEGPTFSNGLEKVIIDYVRLDASVT